MTPTQAWVFAALVFFVLLLGVGLWPRPSRRRGQPYSQAYLSDGYRHSTDSPESRQGGVGLAWLFALFGGGANQSDNGGAGDFGDYGDGGGSGDSGGGDGGSGGGD